VSQASVTLQWAQKGYFDLKSCSVVLPILSEYLFMVDGMCFRINGFDLDSVEWKNIIGLGLELLGCNVA